MFSLLYFSKSLWFVQNECSYSEWIDECERVNTAEDDVVQEEEEEEEVEEEEEEEEDDEDDHVSVKRKYNF